MYSVAEKLTDHVLTLSNLSKNNCEMEQAVRLSLLDYVAVSRAGFCNLLKGETDDIALSALLADGAQGRAVVYGMCAHRLELDDGYRVGGIHIAAPVISALLASRVTTTWAKIVPAVVCGYETAGLLAATMQPNHKRKGFHVTGTCGSVGAAVAVAVAMEQSRDQLLRTISAAAGMASGLLEMQEDGSCLKPLNAGNAASNGVRAAIIGLSNLAFPKDALGGKRGFLACMDSTGVDLSRSEGPVILNVYRKLYPSCRHGHSAIDAARTIRNKLGPRISEITSIEIKTYSDAIFGHDFSHVNTAQQAMMSTPFCVAAMLKSGSLGLDEFDEAAVKDTQIAELAKSVSMQEDEKLSSMAPSKRGAKVRVILRDGFFVEEEVLNPKGEPECPLSDEEIIGKSLPLFMRSGTSRSEASLIIDEILVSNSLTLSKLERFAFGIERN